MRIVLIGLAAAGVLTSDLMIAVSVARAAELRTEHTYRLGDGEARPAATLEDAAWLIGSWTGTAFGQRFEEVWNPPSAGSMVGMFKLYEGDEVQFYELLLLRIEDGTLSLAVRHFNPDFTAWEDKDESVGFRLVKLAEGELHFGGLSFYRRGNDRIDGYIVFRNGDEIREEPLVYARSGSAPALSSAPARTGDQQRSYYFAAAGRTQAMPYRLYVPSSYDAAVGAPLVVALHGYGGDQNYFFDAVDDLPALCERYGFIFAAPMGWSTDGWYGAPLSIPGDAPRSSGRPTPPPARTPDEETRYRDLSEADVMNVIDIVRTEYHVDSSRVFLMGHSMGGFGTWWLGQKHADLWAAIAPMSGVLPDVDYQLPKLADVPVHVSIGGTENPEWVEASRRQVATMKAMGMEVGYFEPEGATHGSMIAPTTPEVFAFFARH